MALEKWLDKVHEGNALELLPQIPEHSVDMTMSSPPYWGLRAYGKDTEVGWPDGWHGQLGLEPTIQEYVDHLCLIISQLKRVLKKTGSLWLNLGDTYSASLGNHGKETAGFDKERIVGDDNRPDIPSTVPRKSLCLIPWRILTRLVDEGWSCRNVVVWHKPNHMPSSVKDRLANSWEPIFHLVQNPKYYYDLDSIREKPLSLREPGINRVRDLGYDSKVNMDGYKVDRVWPRFNIRVRDAQKGRLQSKWGEAFKASEQEIAQYNEKLYSGKFSEMDPAQAELFNSPRARNKRVKGAPQIRGETREEREKQRYRSHMSDFPRTERIKGLQKIEDEIGITGSRRRSEGNTLNPTANLYQPHNLQHPLGKNPSDIVEAGDVQYLKTRPSAGDDPRSKNADRLSQARGHGGWQGNNMVRLDGKTPDDIMETEGYATDGRSLGSNVGEKGKQISDDEQWRPQSRLFNLEGKSPDDVVGTKYSEAEEHVIGGAWKDRFPRTANLEGKNPGDIVEISGVQYIVTWKHNTKARDRRVKESHQVYGHEMNDNTGLRLVRVDGKNPDDVMSLSPETRKLGAIIGDQGAVKVPGGQGWTGHIDGGGARLIREADPRWIPEGGKNPGDYWEITTRPFPESHFAVFPEALCNRPILSTCPVGGIVLDPFAGSGTVGFVAKKLRRHYILLEQKPAYCEMARRRLATHPEALEKFYVPATREESEKIAHSVADAMGIKY